MTSMSSRPRKPPEKSPSFRLHHGSALLPPHFPRPPAIRLHQRRGHRHPVIRSLRRQPILHILRRQQIAHRNHLFLKERGPAQTAPALKFSTPYSLHPIPCLLAIHKHLVVRIVRTLHHNAAELHDNVLRSQRTRNTKLEDPRIRIAQPVILNQVFRNDVSRQHSRA